MNLSTVEPSEAGTGTPKLPPFPQIWIGYVLGAATTVAEFIALTFHPELAKEWSTPPLYLFLLSFVGGVYWFVCIYRLHVVLAQVPGWKHPIAPARAAGFHFIPIYNLYWLFRWPREIAIFVNQRLQRPVMKPMAVSVAALAALLLRVVDPGLGLILLFLPMSYVAECLRRAFIGPAKENDPAS
jgi:hypothetical protein